MLLWPKPQYTDCLTPIGGLQTFGKPETDANITSIYTFVYQPWHMFVVKPKNPRPFINFTKPSWEFFDPSPPHVTPLYPSCPDLML